ncbi:MAG: NAD-dependent dehydratase [Desulfuromonas sp.]|nr:MAG: NAD-dependent dehydratase [Desulfuromonas sp.]
MQVFVTGATGFVGHEVVRQLVAKGHTPHCLVRPGSEGKMRAIQGVEVCHGDVNTPETLAQAMQGCEAIIHLVGIIREFPGRGVTFARLHTEATKNMIAAAQKTGITRYLQMSANGTRAKAVSDYHRSKWAAEEALRASTLDWTIFRPSMIIGSKSEFVKMLAEQIRLLPIVPVIGHGRYPMTPVALEDVAASFVTALEMPQSIKETYHCGGRDTCSYDEILDLVGAALGKGRVRKLHHPVCLIRPVITLLEGIPAFPITRNQLTMLLEGNRCDSSAWQETFGLKPKPLKELLSAALTPP